MAPSHRDHIHSNPVTIGPAQDPRYLAEIAEHKVRLRHFVLFWPIVLNLCGRFGSSVEIWYLHGPDRTTPYDVTMKAVNELYKEGKFKRFGVSNFAACVLLATRNRLEGHIVG